ncbi:MAG: MGMT family protein [Bacteroidales bacterium]
MSKSNRSQNISFFERVYEVVRQIPYGRVTSYGAIARYLGTGQSARMVGWALNVCNHAAIPAHRVVNRNGLLTGKHHFGTPLLMQQLLENEGLVIEDDRILNFHERFWDPSKELSSSNKFCHNIKND